MPPKSAPVPVVYPRLSFAVCADPAKTGVTPELATLIRSKLDEIGCGDLLNYVPPMTYLDAVATLGAEWEPPGTDEFGDDYLFLDREGRKIRCTKNVRNRPVSTGTFEVRAQDILNQRWEFNGESGIVGRDGTVLDFQHTCIALILAWQDWIRDTDPTTGQRRWLSQWPAEKYPDGPTIEKVIVYGIENTDRVVNTINTGKPRSLADVFYRCPYFAFLPAKSTDGVNRVAAAKVAADALRVVWHRTGMYLSVAGSMMTHSESCAWIESHGGVESKLLEAVRVVLDANRDGWITDHVRLGYAAAMLFLMGQWQTPDDEVAAYYGAATRTDEKLTFSGWDRAVVFWQNFGARAKPTDEQAAKGKPGDPTGPLRNLTEVLDAENVIESRPDNDGTRGKQRDYAIVRAWRAYRGNGRTIPPEKCNVQYTRADRYGVRSLDWAADEKTVGGIDLGNDRLAPDPSDDVAATPTKPVPVPVETPKVRSDDETPHYTTDAATPDPVLTAAADGVTDLLALIHQNNPDFDVVLLRTPTGGYAAWGDDEIEKVTPYVTKQPKLHPKGLRFLPLRADEVEVLSDHLTTAGLVLALCVENVAATNGDAKYVVEVVHRGGPVKS